MDKNRRADLSVEPLWGLVRLYGTTLVGPARIQQWLTLDPDGDSTTGKFTVVQWDESGNVLVHVQGNVTGTRVTMETGFQKVQ